MGLQPHNKFQRYPSSRFRDIKKGCAVARAAVPALNLCKKAWLMGHQTHTKFRSIPSSRFRDTEKGTPLHVRMSRCRYPTYTQPMTCVICIAALPLNAHQLWSQSAGPFLSLEANFDTLYAARATYLASRQRTVTPKGAKSDCE